MAFTFQINSDLKFIHDEHFLRQARGCTPIPIRSKAYPTRLVELTQDATKLGGVGTKTSHKDITQLASYGWKRNDTLILDFGSHQVGHFAIDIHSTGSPMDAPLYMRLKFAEMPVELTEDSADYDGWLSRSWIQEEYIHLDVLPARLQLPRRYSFRYVEIKIIDTSPKWQAVFANPLATTTTTAYKNLFKPLVLQDEELQQIYDMSLATLADCMQDVFEDGPKRDRRLWLGDLRLQALASYASYDSMHLVKRCLYLFAGMTTEEGKIPANVFVTPEPTPDDTFLFEYSLFFISVLHDLHNAHPDMDLVQELYPTAKKQLDLTLQMVDAEGRLIPDEDYPIFVDWSNEFNKTTSGQAELIYVLKQFISIAELVDEPELDLYRDKLQLSTDYALTKLYRPERKLFVTGDNEYNIASQVWMVLAGVLSPEENRQLMETTIKELFPIKGIATPYMYHHIVEALFGAGLKDDAVSLMKSYWGGMIRLGADTFWEAYDPDRQDYSPYGSSIVNSYCHAWSCTPVYLITKYLTK